MKRYLFVFATVTTLTFSSVAGGQEGQDQPEPAGKPAAGKPSDVWMRMKLKYGQNIYSSIARADVEAIALDAKRLKTLNWFEGIAHGKDVGYQEQWKVFQLANDKLIEEAEKRNLDGCTLAFMQMTFSCTGCHQRLRESLLPKKAVPPTAP